jgi:hypothetical protein
MSALTGLPFTIMDTVGISSPSLESSSQNEAARPFDENMLPLVSISIGSPHATAKRSF